MKFSNPFNHPAWIDISILLARLVLGLYMAIAGYKKLANGLTKFVDGPFRDMSPTWLPDWFSRPYGYAVPIAELLLGMMLILGLFTRLAAGLMTLLLLSISIAVMTRYGITGVEKGGSFHHAYVMTTLAFLLAIVGSGRLALDPLYFGGVGPDEGGGGGRKKK